MVTPSSTSNMPQPSISVSHNEPDTGDPEIEQKQGEDQTKMKEMAQKIVKNVFDKVYKK